MLHGPQVFRRNARKNVICRPIGIGVTGWVKTWEWDMKGKNDKNLASSRESKVSRFGGAQVMFLAMIIHHSVDLFE